ncbi:Fc.00g091770.m01.CDS01 [Cosmosporella sp. VM-42]
MASTMLQYQTTQQGGPFALATVPRPTPEPTDVCIRIKAVALNPLDWKMVSRGEMVQAWPATFGLDGAGIVEAVGDQVTDFQPGDEVFSLCGIGGKTAGFQEIVTVPQHFVSKKPASRSFEEVASLPICYLTAASAILFGLHVPIPHISSTAPGEPGPKLQTVLILGGASAVGGAAIQMLRFALPDAILLTTASPKHVERLKALGATANIDRFSSTLVSDVTGAAPGGVDAILDCVTAGASEPSVFGALRADGPRLYSQVFTGQKVSVPQDVKSAVVFGRQVFGAPGGLAAISALEQLVEEGKYKLPVPVEVIGKGWDAVGSGLQRFATGVSGQKLVVTI